MSERKRLTPQQSRRVNSLIKKTCCNCIDGNCILLDDGEPCVCPQMISYSLLCKWFYNAVLPADKLLYADVYKRQFPDDTAEKSTGRRQLGALLASMSDPGLRIVTATAKEIAEVEKEDE